MRRIIKIAFIISAVFSELNAFELTPTEIDLGEISVKQANAKFDFSVRLDDSGTCEVDSGCGCISVEEKKSSGPDNPAIKSYSGEIEFGKDKGQIEKRIEVVAKENGISTSKILLLKANVLPVYDILPGTLMRWILPKITSRKFRTFEK